MDYSGSGIAQMPTGRYTFSNVIQGSYIYDLWKTPKF